VGRFEREARIVARLDHPNIVPIYDYDTQDNRPYLVMKYIDGQTLKDRMAESPLTLSEIVSVMNTVASTLDYAHAQGVLHRDLKPSNIILDETGMAYLTDFGLARITHQGESTLSVDSMLGTPHYISPEQALGDKTLDGRTDVYSFGVLLYEMLVGRLPFTADTPYAIVHKHIYASPPAPSSLNPDIPPAVERILLKALAKTPSDRYPTATALMTDLMRALQTTGVDELDASRIERAQQLGESIVMNTPGGRRYSTVSIINGRKSIMLPATSPDINAQAMDLSWQGWIALFMERLKEAIEDIRGQLRQRGIKDRVKTVTVEITDSIRNVTDGAVDIQVGGLTKSADGHTPKTGRIQAAAPVQRRNIRMLQEDWGADEDFVRRRVNKRIKDRRGLTAHILIYIIGAVALLGFGPAIQEGLSALFSSPDFITEVGQSTAQSLAPLANLPIALIAVLGWGGGVLSHILQVFYRTGRRQQNKLDIINREMTELYGTDWRYTVSDKEYRPIREWVRRRFQRRLGFITHAVTATMSTIITLISLPILSQLILNFTQSAFLAQLPSLLLVLILGGLLAHGVIVAISEMFDTGREREIQREVAKEKARLGVESDEKRKNSLSSVEKRKHFEDDSDEIGIRLTADGELTESTVSQFYEIHGLVKDDK
ncbi:MAG: serine/threonine protein kinase, partial [Anaerolineae bacterium]|nr:serine/threonine protein kinase [Anaerolineae bacterium]